MAGPIYSRGKTHYRRYLGGQQTFTIELQQVTGTVAVHFASSMQIDADGAPKGYHEGDQQEYDNHWPCFDWLKNLKQSDRHGQQGIDGAIGPAYGFTISETSLKDHNVTNERNTARYVDASVIPFIVLPADLPLADGTTNAVQIADCIGCLAYVVDLSSGHSTGAVFADVGPHVGEASLATALRLGRTPFYSKYYPKVSGIDAKRFFTVVFPNERLTMPLTVGDVHNRAQALFHTWGDWPGLAQALKQVPKEIPGGAADDNIATLNLPPPKGPVEQHPQLVLDVFRPIRTFFTVRDKAALTDAPVFGDLIANLTGGTELELVEALPDGTWLRVLATVDDRVREGYVQSETVQPR